MISNDEFYKLSIDNNNIAIAKSVLKRFKLSIDERKEIFLLGLWKAIKKQKVLPQCKFSTLLYNNILFCCLDLFYKQQRKKNKIKTFNNLSDAIVEEESDELEQILELGGEYQNILRMRYVDKKTLREIANDVGRSQEWVRIFIKKGLAKIRKFYE